MIYRVFLKLTVHFLTAKLREVDWYLELGVGSFIVLCPLDSFVHDSPA